MRRTARQLSRSPVFGSGFTLVEMMVVIAILAIMAGIAAPAFRDMIAAEKLRSAASALTESLWLARSEAIKRNANVTFSITDVGTGWQVTTSADTATPLHVQEPIGGVTSGAARFEFNAYGRLVSADRKIQLQASNISRYSCVSISDTGRVTVVQTQCGS